MRIFHLLSVVVLAITLSGCKGKATTYPKTAEELREERTGSLTGEGGFFLFGGKKSAGATAGIEVNAYLWRASLDVIHFMPLLSTDPFGGVILSDWHSFPHAPDERLKVDITINSRALRSDAVRVVVFRQVRKQGAWVDAAADPSVGRSIEDKILTRARALRGQTAK